MQEVLFQPFQHSTPLKKKLLYILCLTQTLLGSTLSCIPMLFYRPKFFCTDLDTNVLYQCEEAKACQQPILHFESEYSFTSLSTQYGLYCDRRIIEVNITAAMLFGHVIGAFVSVVLSRYGNIRAKVLSILKICNLLIGASLFALLLFDGIHMIGAILAIWGAIMEVIYSYDMVMPNVVYPHIVLKRVITLLVSAWPILPIFMPLLFYLIGSWRWYLVLAIGVPHICIAYFYHSYQEQLCSAPIQDSPLNRVSALIEAKEKEQRLSRKTQVQEIVQVVDLYRSKYWITFLLYLYIYGGAYVASATSLLSLNSLSGNLYFNITLVNFLETIICFMGSYMGHFFNVHKVLMISLSVMTVGYLAYLFLPKFLQYYVILQGKLFTDTLWTLLNILIYEIVPKRFVAVIITTKSLSCVLTMSIVPYIKYGMESVGLTIFLFSGAYLLLSVVFLRMITPEQKVQSSKELIQIN